MFTPPYAFLTVTPLFFSESVSSFHHRAPKKATRTPKDHPKKSFPAAIGSLRPKVFGCNSSVIAT
jgi:hypothetical protein